MSFQDFLDNAKEIKNFLAKNTGVTTKFLFEKEDENDNSPTFFLPYQKSNPLYRLSTIITGPIALAIIG